MSVQALGWVLDHSPTTGTDRLVLISIANHASKAPNAGAWEGYPGIETITREAGLARTRTTTEVIGRLAATGILEREINGAPDERIPKNRRPNLYRIMLTHGRECGDNDCAWCSPGVTRGDTPEAPGVTRGDTPEGSRGDAEAHSGVTRDGARGDARASPKPIDLTKDLTDTARASRSSRKRAATEVPEYDALKALMSDDERARWASQYGSRARAELEHFIDYHRARDKRMVDWRATLRTWARNAFGTAPRSVGGGRPERAQPAYFDPDFQFGQEAQG